MMNLIDRSKPGRKKVITDDDKCRVCGGKSIGLNFGIHTCSPCKAFFRRNAVKLGTYEFQCTGDGDCPVTSNTRRHCNCCRLAKCIRVGMDRKAIRTDDQRLERIRLIEYNRQKRAEKKQIMIRSTNLLNCNSSSLSLNDQTLLTNIFSAYEQTCVSLKYDLDSNILNNKTLSLQKFINSYADIYMGLIKYFKYVPEFSKLSFYLKKSLLKTNLNQICHLNNALLAKTIGNLDDRNFIVLIQLFPPELFIDSYKSMSGFSPFTYDPILLKLILIVLMFSTHLNIRYDKNNLNDEKEESYSTFNIFNIQNIYVELLWRYILYRCSDYRQAVLLLSSFITRLVYSQYIDVKLNEHISKTTSNEVDQLVPIMKVMWSNN